MTNLVACKFTLEDSQVFEGWFNPESKYWNGWLNPYVNEETFHIILASLFGWHPDDGASYADETLEQLLEIKPNDDGLYYLGHGFIWSEAA